MVIEIPKACPIDGASTWSILDVLKNGDCQMLMTSRVALPLEWKEQARLLDVELCLPKTLSR